MMQRAILVETGDLDPAPWIEEVRSQLPTFRVSAWPDGGEPDEIVAALVWQPRPNLLAGLRNLRLVASIGAGVDHILADPALPSHIHVTRVATDGSRAMMREHVVHQALRFHRNGHLYEEQQRRREWRPHRQYPASNRGVGIMGAGRLGGAAARALADLGFNVALWSRTRKQEPGIMSFAGREELSAFLARPQILVCLLPLTPETTSLLSAALFRQLSPGSFLVHCGRGAQLVEADLLAALAENQLAGAALDVFPEEPLPRESRLWMHPAVSITPHIATTGNPAEAVAEFCENLRRLENDRPLLNLVNRQVGY